MADQGEPDSARRPAGSVSRDSAPASEGDPPFRQLGHFRIAERIGTRAWGEILKGYDESDSAQRRREKPSIVERKQPKQLTRLAPQANLP